MRPWQAAFPDFDRQVYAKAAFGDRQPFGQRPALLIIDVVESFTGTRPQNVLESIDEYRTSCGDQGWEALDSIRRLLDACRDHRLPVVYTKGDVTDKYFCGDSIKGISPVEVLRIYSTPIASAIAPLPTEYVLEKTKASAFFGTPLASYFYRLGVDSLLVCGTSTSGCVRASVVDAFSHNFTVFVVEEGCFDRSPFSNLVNLFEMNAKYANVITLEEALAHVADVDAWRGAPAGASSAP
jgi:nicotinamidase-related amidase